MIKLPKYLKELIRVSDTIIIDFPFLYPIIIGEKKNVILNTHNVEEKLATNSIIKKIVNKIELKAISNCGQSIFCSLDDMSYFKQFQNISNKTNKFFLIENGITPTDFSKNKYTRVSTRESLGISPQTKVILFTGSSYLPNRNALKTLKLFYKNNISLFKELDLLFLIVGTVSDTKSHDGRFVTTSFVDSAFPYFQAADFAINAIEEGSGTNIKMMEYLSAKLPIISTTFGSRGFNLEDEKDCIYYNSSNLNEILVKKISKITKEEMITMANKAFSKNSDKVDMLEIVKKSTITW